MSPSRTASEFSTVVEGVLRNLRADRRLSLEEVGDVWRRLAGEVAAQHSWPRKLSRKRLVVEVENSGWMHLLGLRRQELLEGLVELLGAQRVTGLGFRMGEKKDG